MTNPRCRPRRQLPEHAATVAALALLVGCAERAPDPERDAQASAPPAQAPQFDPALDLRGLDVLSRRTLPGGMVIEELALGIGDACDTNDLVTLRTRERYIDADGSLVDANSTDARRRALTFALDAPGVIEGLRVGVTGMRRGAVRRLTIPASMGYGRTGRTPYPPNATLVFEVELVSFEPR